MTDIHHINATSKVAIAAVTSTAHATVIANFAWQHMKAATTFRDHVIEIEQSNREKDFGAFFEDIRSYGSACILSASASVEALINELFIDPNKPLRQGMPNFESEFWDSKKAIERRPILQKYQIALKMLNQNIFDQQKSPYQDMWALLELRNALVHFKPSWDPDRQLKIDLSELLEGKFELSPFPDVGSDFVTMKCMSAGCMRWVIDTSLAFISDFDNRTSLDPTKMSLFLKLNT